MKNFLLIFITLLFAANSTHSQSKIDAQKLNEMFDVLELNNRMMGTVTLRQNGKIIYSRVLGYRSINGEKKIRSDAETLFRLGSITKVFTAVMIFQLIEEQKLNLDIKLSKFFPEIPNADKISIEQLLSHRSGLANYPQDVDYSDPKAWIYQPQTRAQILARLAASKPIFAPGEKRHYSNTNFVLLGYIIEVLTKSEYATQLNKRIIKKLGLKNTHFGRKIDGSKNEAFSFNYQDSKWESVLEQDMSVAGGAGGIASTTGDLTKFLDALFKNKLLKSKTLKEMLTPPPDNFSDHTKAFGRAIIFDTGKKGYSHDGGIDAFTSLFVYVKEDDLAFAITINGNNYPTNRIFWNVLKIYYNQSLAIPSFKAVKLPDETLSRYEGTFNLKQIGMKITIRKDKDGLLGEVSKDDFFQLTPIGNNSFFHEPSGIIIEFKENPDRSIPSFTMYQGRGVSVWEKD